MGNLLPSTQNSFKIMMTGIDNNVELIPEIIEKEDVRETYGLLGMPVLTFEYKNLLINTWPRNRVTDKEYLMVDANKSYFEGNAGIIFVINSESMELLDRDYEYQRKMLDDLLNDEKFKGLPILLIANKQEKDQPVKANEICEKWDITNIIKNRKWSIMEFPLGFQRRIDQGIGLVV